jgi:serine/threonine-protein kinase RsbW
MPRSDAKDDAEAGADAPPHVLRLRQDLSEVMRMNAWLEDVAASLGLTDATRDDVKLCLNEAVTNALSYGFPDRSDGVVEVGLSAGPDGLRVHVRDDGVPFDPVAAPLAEPAKDIASAAIGGLGITLIRQTASRVDYARAEGRNVLAMHFPRH